MNFGFVNISACAPKIQLADPAYNVQQIENEIIQAEGRGVEIIMFPELCLTGYTCGDLFLQQTLIEEAEMALITLMQFTRSLNIISIVGLPVPWRGTLLNCAAVIQRGKILGLVPKTYLPNYKEFYEMRWFHSGQGIDDMVWLCGSQVPLTSNVIFNSPSCRFGIEICEDLWAPIPPSSLLFLAGADIIFNLSADNDTAGKRTYVKSILSAISARCIGSYVYAGCGYGESTQDIVFDGKAFVYECGKCLAETPCDMTDTVRVDAQVDVERIRNARRANTTFTCNGEAFWADGRGGVATPHPKSIDCELFTPKQMECTRVFSQTPFVPHDKNKLEERCRDVFAIQNIALCKRLEHTQAKTAVIGVSGGLDSTLALLVTARAMDRLGRDRKNIVAVTMPGFGTTKRTHDNALALIQHIGCTCREVCIVDSVNQHFKDLGIDPTKHDTTYENCQARERTQILMDIANQTGGMVIGTGDMSELALGWATYNGDHMSMYGVNAGVPKTLIKHIIEWAARTYHDESMANIVADIIDTPISPELTPATTDGNIQQKTEDLVGPYELHDFFLYHTLRHGFRPSKIVWMAERTFKDKYDHDIIVKWIKTFFQRFFQQQYKRSCLPDGPKVLSIGLSPRGDWRMPSDANASAWLAECDKL